MAKARSWIRLIVVTLSAIGAAWVVCSLVVLLYSDVGNRSDSSTATAQSIAQEQQQATQATMHTPQFLGDRLEYFKDSRTGLCFAVYYGFEYGSGPTMVLVPEDSIPKRLLKEILTTEGEEPTWP